MIPFTVGAATSAGLVRSANEDAYFVGDSVVAVADGMGGHAAGRRAADIVISMVEELGARATSHSMEEVVAMVEAANAAVLHEAERDDACHGMGATLVGLALTEISGSPHGLVFNVGDSRLYTVEGDLITQVTVDHSEVQELLEAGRITADEMAVHPHRNIITRSMGSQPTPIVDTWMLPWTADTTFVLCSDGLTTEVSDDLILQILATDASAQVTADRLVQAAEAGGGRDNVTVLVVRPERVQTLSDDDTLPRGLEVAR